MVLKMNKLQIGSKTIPYDIQESKNRKRMGLTIDPKGKLTVRTPLYKTSKEINQFLQQKKPWILQKSKETNKFHNSHQPLEFLSGEKLYYKGRRYRLKVKKTQHDKIQFKFDKGTFLLTTSKENRNVSQIKNKVQTWFQTQAETHFPQRVNDYAKKLGVSPSGVKIIDTERFWGENRSENILLNWRLIMAPISVQDYIIVHELSHLKESKHSTKFWDIVSSVLPDFKQRKEWLREHTHELYF